MSLLLNIYYYAMDYIFKYCKILLPYYDDFDFITQNRLCLLNYC